MFARKVSMHLKAGCAGEFIKKMETEVIPLLLRQKGFLDEITGALRVHTDMVANSTFHKMASAVAS